MKGLMELVSAAESVSVIKNKQRPMYFFILLRRSIKNAAKISCSFDVSIKFLV